MRRLTVSGACIMAGPLFGGTIADHIGWQWAFWINIPPLVLSFLGILYFFPEESPRTSLFTLSVTEKVKRLDPVGSALLIITLSCLISVLQNYSYSSDLTIGAKEIALSVVAVVAFALFLAQEASVRPDLALMPRSLVVRRSIWATSLMLFLVFTTFTNFVFFFAIFQQVSPRPPLNHLLTRSSRLSRLFPYVLCVPLFLLFNTAIGLKWSHE